MRTEAKEIPCSYPTHTPGAWPRPVHGRNLEGGSSGESHLCPTSHPCSGPGIHRTAPVLTQPSLAQGHSPRGRTCPLEGKVALSYKTEISTCRISEGRQPSTDLTHLARGQFLGAHNAMTEPLGRPQDRKHRHNLRSQKENSSS